MALKLSCGQESLQKSKQLCLLSEHAASAVWLKACLLAEAQKPAGDERLSLSVGKQHTWLSSPPPSLARLGAVAMAQKLSGTGDMLGLSQQQAGLLL